MSDNETPPNDTANGPADEAAVDPANGAPSTTRPLLKYTLARLGILLGCMAAAYLLGARGVLWIIVSFVTSALLAYLLLGKLRDEISANVGNHFDKLESQVEEEGRGAHEELPTTDEQSDSK